ncbi:LMBR1-like membrane protein [Leishmania donovani]|uniref:LMBR1-like membrane family protein n=1 Tax=Leishmania donovani TaxID=5661 RepID=A0A504XB75_LEIDO|nr:LMBR1-like membrane family protein [Leishmania donovani]CAJ1990839.1 LMBR1-like membrane protein [Leishmania donovani]VDZ46690.1 LMBR1-like_membrane_protein_putative/Pfam:PF04791 [Leishmania donovani]
MSGGYIAVTVIFFVLALGVCLLTYHYYTKVSIKQIPLACAVWHVIALYMCMLPFPLLVVDIDASLAAQSDASQKQDWMRPIWITIFAVTYFCAWVSLPLAQMYTEVGEFTVKGRLLHSIKLNLILYAVIIVIVLAALGYFVVITNSYRSVAKVMKVVISLANAWGLLILTLFMPAGLVGVPRMLWRYADAKRLLRRQLYEATDIQEDLDLAAMDLASIKAELISIDPQVSEEDRPHLAFMLEIISAADREIPMYHIAALRVKTVPSTERNDVSLLHLETLNQRLKKAIKIANRANYRWNSTVRKCDSLDQIVRGVKGTNNRLKRMWFPIRQYVYYTGCFVCSVLTIFILWSELTMPLRDWAGKPLGVIELVMKSSIHFIGSVVLLFYMAYCAYWAAFQFKVHDVYVVYPSIADNASLCFNETFLVRLLMPLCFNFLLISGLSSTASETRVDVAYGHVYRSNMDIGLLFGSYVNKLLPLMIPFIAATVFFQLTQQVLSVVGIEVHNPNDVENPAVRQRIIDGRKLVEAELGYQLTSPFLSEEGVTETKSPSPSPRAARPGRDGVEESDTKRGQRYRDYLQKKRGSAGSAADGGSEMMNFRIAGTSREGEP